MAWNHSKYFEWRLLREPHHKHLQYPSTSRKCLKSKSWLTHVRRDAAPPDPGQQPRRITVFKDQDIDIGTLSDIFADDLRVYPFVSWTQDRERLVGLFLCIFLGNLFAESFHRSRIGSHPGWNFKLQPQNMQLQRSSPQKPGQLSLELRFSSHKCFLVWSCPIHRGKYY